MWTSAPDSPFPANCENTFNSVTKLQLARRRRRRGFQNLLVFVSFFSAGCTIGLAVLYPSEWNSMNIWSSVGTLTTPPTGIYAGDAPLPSYQPQIPPSLLRSILMELFPQFLLLFLSYIELPHP